MARNLREVAPFQEAIAERQLLFTAADGSTRDVLVQIGRPVKDPEDTGNALCPFRVLGFEEPDTFVAGGVDSVQALILALEVLTDYLAAKARTRGGSISFLGSSHLGFPPLGGSQPKAVHE